MDRLGNVTVSVEPADTQTEMRLSTLSMQERRVKFGRIKNDPEKRGER